MKYFSAAWCGPCKAFKPVMTEIKGEGYQVEFIDIDNLSDLAQEYNVRSVPTVVIEENGKEVRRKRHAEKDRSLPDHRNGHRKIPLQELPKGNHALIRHIQSGIWHITTQMTYAVVSGSGV